MPTAEPMTELAINENNVPCQPVKAPMAAIGAFTGWQGVLFSLMVSSLIGSAVGIVLILMHRREWSSRMPYGPYIAMAAVIWVFAGTKILALIMP